MGDFVCLSGSMLKLTFSFFIAFVLVTLTKTSGADNTEVRKLDTQPSENISLVKRDAAKKGKRKGKNKKQKERRKQQNKIKQDTKRCKGEKCRKGKGGGKATKRKNDNKKKYKNNKENKPKGRNRKNGKKNNAKRKNGKGKGNNKGKKKGRKSKKGKGLRKEARQQFDDCFPKIFAYTKMLKKSRNIQQQFTRINGTKDKIAGKAGKKD